MNQEVGLQPRSIGRSPISQVSTPEADGPHLSQISAAATACMYEGDHTKFAALPEEDQKSALAMLGELCRAVDQGRGSVSSDELYAAIRQVKDANEGVNHNEVELNFMNPPPVIDDVFKPLDTDGSGKISAVELAKETKRQYYVLRKLIMVFAVAFVAGSLLLAGSTLGASYMVAQWAQDVKRSDDGTLQWTRDSKTVEVASSDMYVEIDGSLRKRTHPGAEGSNARIAVTSQAMPLPALYVNSSRRLSSGRRLVEDLGLEEYAEEVHVTKRGLDAVVDAVHQGQTEFMDSDGAASMAATFRGMNSLDTSVLTPEALAGMLYYEKEDDKGLYERHNFAVLCADDSAEECTVMLPKLTAAEARRLTEERGRRLLCEGGERRLVFGFAIAMVVASSIPAVTALVIEGTDNQNNVRRRRSLLSTGTDVAGANDNVRYTKRSRRSGCFPADARLAVRGPVGHAFKLMAMSTTMTGDHILSGLSGALPRVEPALLEMHSPLENAMPVVEFVRLGHEEGLLDVTSGHFVLSKERGMVPAGDLAIGDHIYSLPSHLMEAESFELKEVSFKTSRIVTKGLVNKTGKYSKLTYSGSLVVNGVMTSAYAMDQVETFLPRASKRASLLNLIGYGGLVDLTHLLTLPMRLMHYYAPSSWVSTPFWSPSEHNANVSLEGDALPLYVDYAGRLAGKALELVV